MSLNPCPVCKSITSLCIAKSVVCTNPDCQMAGPVDDPDGKKWNTLTQSKNASCDADSIAVTFTAAALSGLLSKYGTADLDYVVQRAIEIGQKTARGFLK